MGRVMVTIFKKIKKDRESKSNSKFFSGSIFVLLVTLCIGCWHMTRKLLTTLMQMYRITALVSVQFSLNDKWILLIREFNHHTIKHCILMINRFQFSSMLIVVRAMHQETRVPLSSIQTTTESTWPYNIYTNNELTTL